MVSDFMSFPGSPRNDFRMFRDVFADHEKGGLDVMRGKQIKQLGSKGLAWSIIKRHGDVRAIDMHRIKRNARIFRGGLGFVRRMVRRRRGIGGNRDGD